MKFSRANLISQSGGARCPQRAVNVERQPRHKQFANRFEISHPGALGTARPTSAFTMIEIALSLAIIGFALVAIIGVLPAGLSVQRNNREETIISQDATYLMDAIRSGARGLDDLTNYVYAITNVVTGFDEKGKILPNTPPFPITLGYTYTNYTINNVLQPPADHIITNGYRIIGLLSTPKYSSIKPDGSPSTRFSPAYDSLGNRTGFGAFLSNYVTAYVRAISGNATEKPPQDNASVGDLAFKYKLISEITPYSSTDTNWVNYTDPGITANEVVARSNNWLVARNLNANLHDLRLRFLWPLLPNGSFGNGRQTYRTMAGGYLLKTNPPFYHFASRAYLTNNTPTP